MARQRTRVPLNVFLNSRLVGRLQRQSSGAIDFQYDRNWLDWEHASPVSLSLPLREDRFIGDPVIAVFDNLLPDNDQIRRRLAERVGAAGKDAYSLLAAVGRDCVGALQFLPDGEEPDPAGGISARPLSDTEIAGILGDLKRTPLGVDESGEFRISLAGAQEKTALLYWQDKWQMPHGTTATTHILKPEIGKLPNGIDLTQSIENEHLCMRLMTAFGLPAAKTQMLEFSGKRALVVERFDRHWALDGRLLRLPQEDCCQALSVPPTRKYESEGGPGIRQVLDLLKASDEPDKDQRLFLKAQIVFWLLGATDGHAKNFSIYLFSGGRFHLTPLYDVMSAQPNVDAGQIQHNRMKFAMAVGDRRYYTVNSIMPRHFLQTVVRCGLSGEFAQGILDEILAGVDSAIDAALAGLPAGFPESVSASITDGIRARLQLIAQEKTIGRGAAQ
ncbi:MAG TPA: type II toxin-antitoxin system HipA family toxin [Gammaproteobacteria bacterium]|nr:type II toxin-antitoxin system HipA family toxin [Gammaproteobacteria bacterium]